MFQSLPSLIGSSQFPGIIRDKDVIQLDTGAQKPGLAAPDSQCISSLGLTPEAADFSLENRFP